MGFLKIIYKLLEVTVCVTMSMQSFIQIGPMLRVHRGIFAYICSNHYIQIFEHGSLLTHFPSLPQLAIRGTVVADAFRFA